MIKASVIIPNWNGRTLLQDCLSSLKQQSFKNFEIILVDNHSFDNSIKYTEEMFPQVKVIRLNKNYGFARAINEGVKNSLAEYVVFLNNDTAVDKNWLENLVETADRYPEVIAVNSKILNFYERKKIDGVGILVNEVGQARSIGWGEKDFGQYNKEQYIFGATGGASLFRRQQFTRVGGFDEHYFMYFEEVDFAFRAQFLGFKFIYCPGAVVYHKHKATAKKTPSKVEYWQFKNMTQTILSDFPSTLLLKRWRFLKIILVHFNTIFYQVKNGFFWPPILTEFWLLWNLHYLLQKRRKIQRKRLVSDDYIDSFLQDKKITFYGMLR